MNKIILALCLVLVSATATQAQKVPVPRRAIGLSLGWQNMKMLDQHASPLAYGTNSIFPRVGLSYSRQTGRSAYDIEVSGASGQINPARFGARQYKAKWSQTDSFQYTLSSPIYMTDIKVSYYRNLGSLSTGNQNYWVGGALEESAYLAPEMMNMPWLYNAVDLSPAVAVNYEPSFDHNIGIKVDFAAIALVSRATYGFFAKSNKDKNVKAFLKQGTRAVLPNKYRKGNLNLFYRYQVSRKFAMGSSYKLKWTHYSVPKPLRVLDKSLDFKFSYTY